MNTFVFIHSFFIVIAFIISFFILCGKKGNKRHKLLGWVFTISMFLSIISSFFITTFGSFSYIHILSVITIYWIIQGVLAARLKRTNWRYIHVLNMGSAYIGIIIAGVGVLIRYLSTPVNPLNGYIASGITACVAIPLLIQKVRKYAKS